MRTSCTLLSGAVAVLMAAAACSSNKRVPVYNDMSDEQQEEVEVMASKEVLVPFRVENGVKYLNVSVNGVGLEMIFDTGCSGALISVAEANYLYQKGKLTDDDILGMAHSQIADGSVVENMVINLREVVIHDKIVCRDVQATVSGNINAPLLLGNAVLDRAATVTIDNERQCLIFKTETDE